MIYDHCQYHFKAFKKGPTSVSTVFGPTCDAFDKISVSEDLPVDLEVGDLLYSENIGAYSTASATNFNGIPPPAIISL